MMMAWLGLITLVLLLAVIASRVMSPLVALIVVPVTASLVAGFGLKTAQFMVAGLQQTASVAAMFSTATRSSSSAAVTSMSPPATATYPW